MTSPLIADFSKRRASQLVVYGKLQMPLDRFGITVLFGPSGSGKTTVLRCLAGLEQPSHGMIHGGDQLWFDSSRDLSLPPQRRDIGFCFQDLALFPHLSIAENVGFGHRGSRAETRRAALNMLDRFRISETADRLPRQVSGGQAQRAALARALMRRPRLLLLDEPLSSLDSALREEMRRELRSQLSEFSMPTILVTHDRLEALTLADQIVVMDRGEVLQADRMQAVFSRPASPQVAKIVGIETILEGLLLDSHDGLAAISIGGITLRAVPPPESCSRVYVCIRAEDVTLTRQPTDESSSRNRLRCGIQSIQSEGALLRVALDAGFPLTAMVTRPAVTELRLQPGDEIVAAIKASSIHLIARP